MNEAVLQRRPLPKCVRTNADHHNKVKFNAGEMRKSTVETVEDYWKCEDATIDDIPSFQYSYENLYFYRTRGPDPFPFRYPKRLPRLYKKQRHRDSHYNVSDEFLSSCKLDVESIDSVYGKVETGMMKYILGSNMELQHTVSKEDMELEEIAVETESTFITPLQLAGQRAPCPWNQVSLEEQLLEIDKLLEEQEIPTEVRRECFRPSYEHSVKILNESVDLEMENDLYPKTVFSFKVEQPKKMLTEESTAIREDTCTNTIGRTVLDLKASYLECLPDIPPHLINNLTSINLSFNCLSKIPKAIFNMKNIVSLNMRNNPLSVISDKIKKMTKLRFLNLSFCKLTHVNVNVCSLHDLEKLDLSNNFLTSLPEDIEKLRSLKELLVDGNRIEYFPRTFLHMKLGSFKCNSNYLSMIFWKTNCGQSFPQRLMDMAIVTLARNNHLNRVPDTIQEKLFDGSHCPYCDVLVSGAGVAAMKPAEELFGVRNLPLMFFVCSQTCKLKLQESSTLPLVNYYR